LFALRWQSVPEFLPQPRKKPPSGFGYPRGGVSSTHPREPLSAPHALGLRPSKFFSAIRDEKRFLASPFRPYAFFQNLIGLEPALQRTNPRTSAVPLTAPERVSFGRGLYSLGHSDLLGFLSSDSTYEASTSYVSLSGSGTAVLTERGTTPLKDSRTPEERRSPLARVPAYLAFLTGRLSHLFNHRRPADYFFLSRTPASYEEGVTSLSGLPAFS
jgi:hypothetical protein